jgi:di/tricarboxylate transporter
MVVHRMRWQRLVMPWLSKSIATSLGGLSWPIVLVILILFYFYSHYLFASSTAHISAMYAALLGLILSSLSTNVFESRNLKRIESALGHYYSVLLKLIGYQF